MITVTAWQPLAAGLIKPFEGCKLTAYPDPATGGDPWTIGWGATGPDIRKGVVWTQVQADDRFMEHLQHFGDGVATMVKTAPTTAHQFAALVSLAYNIGLENLRRSSLLRLHMTGDYPGAQGQFIRWNKANGRVMRGLTRRRAAEAEVYGKADA